MKLTKFLKKNIKQQSLDKHKVIGIDLDYTLINGPHSKKIREYIKDSKASYHVITFRPVVPEEIVKELMKLTNIQSINTLPAEIVEYSEEYLEWKGKVCSQLHCTALLDDDILAVIDGCKKYKIQIFNSLKWPQYRKDSK